MTVPDTYGFAKRALQPLVRDSVLWTLPETMIGFWADFRASGDGFSINGGGPAATFINSLRGTVQLVGDGIGNFPDYSLQSAAGGAQNDINITQNPTYWCRWAQFGTIAGTRRIGAGSSFGGPAEPTNGIYFRAAQAGAITGVCRKAAVETAIASGVLAANGVFHTGKFVVSQGGGLVTFFVDGVLLGSIATNVPTIDLTSRAGDGADSALSGMEIDYMAMAQAR
jgi:hypothetical protein